jgi:hypothetical protein
MRVPWPRANVGMVDAAPMRGATDELGEVKFRLESGSEVVLKAWRGSDFAAAGPPYFDRCEPARTHQKPADGMVAVGEVTDESGATSSEFEPF